MVILDIQFPSLMVSSSCATCASATSTYLSLFSPPEIVWKIGSRDLTLALMIICPNYSICRNWRRSYVPTVRFRLPPRQDNVITFNYGAIANFSRDLHPANGTPSRAYVRASRGTLNCKKPLQKPPEKPKKTKNKNLAVNIEGAYHAPRALSAPTLDAETPIATDFELSNFRQQLRMLVQQLEQQHGRFMRLRFAALVVGKGTHTAAKQFTRISLAQAEFLACGA